LNRKVSPERPKFELRCHAGNAGRLEVVSDAVSVTIGQQIRREEKNSSGTPYSWSVSNRTMDR